MNPYNADLGRDPTILECCLQSYHQQPYIGVDQQCLKQAIFCIQHSSHTNQEGLIHQMMPLKSFKRTVHSKKFLMQQKIQPLIETFNNFMDQLIQNIKQLKLRKSIQLSMLWLRQLAHNQEQYQMMRKIYRMDFRQLTCRDIHSIYYKIIHNDGLYDKDLKEIKCYEGIVGVLEDLQKNDKANKIISDKIIEIQGLLSDGKILQKILPDKRMLKPHIKQILLEQSPASFQNNFQINYHKAISLNTSTKFYSIFSKYPMIPHTTYHLSIKTKYSNVMLGICSKDTKQQNNLDLHYSPHSIVYNCANGYTYKDGTLFSGSCAQIKGLNQIVLKMRITDKQIIIMTKDKVLMRSNINKIIGKRGSTIQEIYLHVLGRMKGDAIQVERDKEVSADNIAMLKAIGDGREQQEQQEQDQQQQYEEQYKQQVQPSNQSSLPKLKLNNNSKKQSLKKRQQYSSSSRKSKKIVPTKQQNLQMEQNNQIQQGKLVSHPILKSQQFKSESDYSYSNKNTSRKQKSSVNKQKNSMKNDQVIFDNMKMIITNSKISIPHQGSSILKTSKNKINKNKNKYNDNDNDNDYNNYNNYNYRQQSMSSLREMKSKNSKIDEQLPILEENLPRRISFDFQNTERQKQRQKQRQRQRQTDKKQQMINSVNSKSSRSDSLQSPFLIDDLSPVSKHQNNNNKKKAQELQNLLKQQNSKHKISHRLDLIHQRSQMSDNQFNNNQRFIEQSLDINRPLFANTPFSKSKNSSHPAQQYQSSHFQIDVSEEYQHLDNSGHPRKLSIQKQSYDQGDSSINIDMSHSISPLQSMIGGRKMRTPPKIGDLARQMDFSADRQMK